MSRPEDSRLDGADHPFFATAGGQTWVVVLAAGEGSRLRVLTTTASGLAVPKQFCSLNGGPSLLHAALERARAVASPERTCVIVAREHRRWWSDLAASVPAENVIVQPRNRGTAHGILLPLLHILRRDPDASLLILPSDHFVKEEAKLSMSLQQAMAQVERQRDRAILLGFTPDDPDPELGYVVPGTPAGAGVYEVDRFVEKPSVATARALIERGAAWNAFILAAHARTLLQAFEAHDPRSVQEMRRIIDSADTHEAAQQALSGLYERLSDFDFSRGIAQEGRLRMRMLTVPPCGWSDLGTPRRVAAVLGDATAAVQDWVEAHSRGFLNLAAQHARLDLGGEPLAQ